jgi:hypothetical protein
LKMDVFLNQGNLPTYQKNKYDSFLKFYFP